MTENNLLDSTVLTQTNPAGQSSEFTGTPQPQGAQPTPAPVNNGEGNVQVNPTPGPDAAFAQMRRELEQYKAIATNPEVQALLQQKRAAEEAARAQNLGVNQAMLQELEQLKAFQYQQQQLQYSRALLENENATKAKFQMDDNAFNELVDHIGKTYPEVSTLLQHNPNLDLTPYIAAWRPDAYARFMAGVPAPQQAPRAVYVPGHGVGAGVAEAQDLKFLQDRIRSVAGKGLEHLNKK